MKIVIVDPKGIETEVPFLMVPRIGEKIVFSDKEQYRVEDVEWALDEDIVYVQCEDDEDGG